MSITYIRFYQACKVQGLDRSKLPYTGWFQPYCAWFALVWMTLVTGIYGYTSFGPSDLTFSTSTFFSNYTMQLFIPPLFIIWKVIHKTKWIKSSEADLVWEKPIIDAYEQTFMGPPIGFWTEMGQLIGIGRNKGKQANRRSSIHQQDVDRARSNMGHDLFDEK
jgi:amino acid transporter